MFGAWLPLTPGFCYEAGPIGQRAAYLMNNEAGGATVHFEENSD
jgi:hypothetical protein